MDSPTPEDTGTVIGWVVAAMVAAGAVLRKFGAKLFTSTDYVIHTEIAASIKKLDEKLDVQNEILSGIVTNIAVSEERFRYIDRRLIRLEDK